MDHVPSEFLVGLALGHAEQIFEQLVLRIGAGQRVGRCIVGATHIPRVARIAAAIEFFRPFQNEDGSALLVER